MLLTNVRLGALAMLSLAGLNVLSALAHPHDQATFNTAFENPYEEDTDASLQLDVVKRMEHRSLAFSGSVENRVNLVFFGDGCERLFRRLTIACSLKDPMLQIRLGRRRNSSTTPKR
jgi:hypothetical protein